MSEINYQGSKVRNLNSKEGISFVIPVLNEAENIADLHAEVVSTGNNLGLPYEIIIVNDGSTDHTELIVTQLRPVKLINFRKKFGQTAALDAGIKAANYSYIVTMDGDGQNDPANTADLLQYLKKHNLDVVSGWRTNRKDPFLKKLVSRVANIIRTFLVSDGINDSGCTLKIYKKECFEDIHLYGEMHRFIPGILKQQGYKIGEIPVNHRPRTKGQTKYNYKRTLKGMLDMVSLWFYGKYAVRPLHLLGGIGFLMFVLSFIFGCVSVIQLINGQDLSETFWPVLSLFTLLFSIVFVIFGLIFDLLIKNYFENSGLKPYKVRDIKDYN